jgi:hypothetical protein
MIQYIMVGWGKEAYSLRKGTKHGRKSRRDYLTADSASKPEISSYRLSAEHGTRCFTDTPCRRQRYLLKGGMASKLDHTRRGVAP